MGLIYSQENNTHVEDNECTQNAKIEPNLSNSINASETEKCIESCEDNSLELYIQESVSEENDADVEGNCVDNHDYIEQGEESLLWLDDNVEPDCNGNELDDEGNESFVDIKICNGEVTSQKRKRSSNRIAENCEKNIGQETNDKYMIDEDSDMVMRKGKRAKQ